MAYSANAYGTFVGRPDHRLNLYVYVAEQDAAGNRSRLAWGLYAERTGAWQGSFNNSSFGFSVNVGGNITNGAASLPFSAGASQLTLATGEHWFAHDGNGYLTVYFSAVMPNAAQFGTAQTGQGRLDADRIVPAPVITVPGAPSVIGVDQIDYTSFRYRFSGTTDGGAPIREWQVGFGTNPVTPTEFVGSTGTTTITGRTPGTDYYVWSRGRNDVGWGPWSARTGVRTTSAGGRLKVGTQWKTVLTWIKVDGTWRRTRALVKTSSGWRAAR